MLQGEPCEELEACEEPLEPRRLMTSLMRRGVWERRWSSWSCRSIFCWRSRRYSWTMRSTSSSAERRRDSRLFAHILPMGMALGRRGSAAAVGDVVRAMMMALVVVLVLGGVGFVVCDVAGIVLCRRILMEFSEIWMLVSLYSESGLDGRFRRCVV